MKYKLIKEYPGSPKLGFEIYKSERDINLNIICYNPENYPEFWKKVIEKDYEILSLICTRGDNTIITYKNGGSSYRADFFESIYSSIDYWVECFTGNNNPWKIYSVKRLSDGEIFTIGDKIQTSMTLTINGFIIIDNELLIDPFEIIGTVALNRITKAKTPLFTTEDGVDIFKNIDKYYTPIYIVDKALSIRYCEKDFNVKPSTNVKYFSTKEKAEEFILMNKPVLSLKEVLDVLDLPLYKNHTSLKFKDKLKDLVKSKIKQSV